MTKVLHCSDLVKECSFQARGTEDEILAQAARHAKEIHNLDPTADLVAAVKKVIREDAATRA